MYPLHAGCLHCIGCDPSSLDLDRFPTGKHGEERPFRDPVSARFLGVEPHLSEDEVITVDNSIFTDK